jgi:threonine synthase
MHYQGLINKYRKYLPVTETTPIVTLNEGNTPLIKADNLAKKSDWMQIFISSSKDAIQPEVLRTEV